MQIGMVGLGRMGANMARRLLRGGHDVVAHDHDPEATSAIASESAVPAASLDALVAALAPPRAVWVMVPAGAPTDETVRTLRGLLARGDVIIDGGNTFYQDDVRRAAALAERGIDYLDVGTSGGVWGLERGYCLMIGGPAGAVARLEPVFRTLAPGAAAAEPTAGRRAGAGSAQEGFLHCGPAGSGHFVKMIHNGIEYGLMQAYAEGFELLQSARLDRVPDALRYDLDVAEIAELWRRGSVIGSWLLDLTARALAADPQLDGFDGRVHDSGEGRWTVQTAIERAVPAPVLAASLFARFRSRQDETFANKLLSALRHQFGGHGEAPPRE